MEYIAHSHYKLLKKLHKHKLKKSQLTESELEDINYLGDNGCIRYEGVSSAPVSPLVPDIEKKGSLGLSILLV